MEMCGKVAEGMVPLRDQQERKEACGTRIGMTRCFVGSVLLRGSAVQATLNELIVSYTHYILMRLDPNTNLFC